MPHVFVTEPGAGLCFKKLHLKTDRTGRALGLVLWYILQCTTENVCVPCQTHWRLLVKEVCASEPRVWWKVSQCHSCESVLNKCYLQVLFSSLSQVCLTRVWLKSLKLKICWGGGHVTPSTPNPSSHFHIPSVSRQRFKDPWGSPVSLSWGCWVHGESRDAVLLLEVWPCHCPLLQ